MSWEENIQVFKDTRGLSLTTYKEQTEKAKAGTTVYTDPLSLKVKNKDTEQYVEFKAMGTISGAYEINFRGGRVGVLNFADALEPGGLVLQGEVTQEECLCRCSNLYECLIQDFCMKDYYIYNETAPMHVYSDRVIYSRDVLVFKDDIDYSRYNEPFYCDVITCPSPSTQVKEEILYNRILGILNTARYNEVQNIVLGAWGCGAFGQDATVVGRCFAKALTRYNFFEQVIFAVRPSYTGERPANLTKLKLGFHSVTCRT